MKLPHFLRRSQSLDERLQKAAQRIMLQGERGTLWYSESEQTVWFVVDGYIGSTAAVKEQLSDLGLSVRVDDNEEKMALGWHAPTPTSGWQLISPFQPLG